MIRIVKLSGRFLGVKIESITDDAGNIRTFVNEGTPVILVSDLDDLESLGIDPTEVEWVNPE